MTDASLHLACRHGNYDLELAHKAISREHELNRMRLEDKMEALEAEANKLQAKAKAWAAEAEAKTKVRTAEEEAALKLEFSRKQREKERIRSEIENKKQLEAAQHADELDEEVHRYTNLSDQWEGAEPAKGESARNTQPSQHPWLQGLASPTKDNGPKSPEKDPFVGSYTASRKGTPDRLTGSPTWSGELQDINAKLLTVNMQANCRQMLQQCRPKESKRFSGSPGGDFESFMNQFDQATDVEGATDHI